MRRPKPQPAPDLVPLLELIRCGRLDEVEAWVASGKRLSDPSNEFTEFSPLVVAAGTGFHSLVVRLLKVPNWSQEERDEAAAAALQAKRIDLVDLLLANGAEASSLDFKDVCATLDPAIMERFLRLGVDPMRENGFARALEEFKARPLLGFCRSLGQEFPALRQQAALALAEAIKEESLHWTSLLRWAGADPLIPVPESIYHTNWDSENHRLWSPAELACRSKEPTFLKALKLKPTPEQARDLLWFASLRHNPEIIRTLIKIIPGKDLDEPDTRSCKAVEYLVSNSPLFEAHSHDRERSMAACLEMLLDAGAHWNPRHDYLGGIRRDLVRNHSSHVVRIVRLLLYVPGAAQRHVVLELCRTPVIRRKIYDADRTLAKEMDALA